MQHATADRTASTLLHWVGENNNLDVCECIRLLLETHFACFTCIRFAKIIQLMFAPIHVHRFRIKAKKNNRLLVKNIDFCKYLFKFTVKYYIIKCLCY